MNQITEKDFYGYSRSGSNRFLYSTDYASVVFDNTGVVAQSGDALTRTGHIGLVQSVTAVYQHRVEPRFEAGSSELVWLTGQARGMMEMGRLVSDQGLLAGVSHGQAPGNIGNGAIGGVQLHIARGSTIVRAADAKNHLVLKGCVMSSYSLTFATGGLEVAEMVRIECALVKRGQGQSTNVALAAAANGEAISGAIAGGFGVNISSTP